MYFYEWFGKLSSNNQVREDRIMRRIEVVAKEIEEGREKIREEMKSSEARVMVEVDTLKCSIEYIYNSMFIFNIDPIVVAPTPYPIVVAPTLYLAVDLP